MDNIQSAILSRFTNAIPTPIRLRDLIRQIRAARTAADERAVVQKECAYIRSTFREEDNAWRCRNVAKLLYIHMLGYPAHFGQLECLKLIASTRYTDKRIGYLGAMLLLDERQDVHLLITNSLKNDLNNSQQFVVGLALCCLGSICSSEMSRDLLGEVERLMKSSNSYIKKKAALCASRMVRKLPELSEMLLPVAKGFLSEKNHGCLVTGITLITEMCDQNGDALNYFKKNIEFVHNLVRILKNLIMSGYSPEHDVSGVSDPFLQVKILRLLRTLGRNDGATSEAMNDILAQVATNTESSKNVGNAILYETVISIMEIKSESGLRVLGINILGRFLLNTDKNIRYVALTTLLRTVQADYNAVQRHRTTIVECLKDPDVSIRKKSMELCFALINENNIKTMSKELILFLEKADPEFKSLASSNLCISAEKYAPDPKWHIDTVVKILNIAGNYIRDDVVGLLIELISSSESLHSYAVCQLWLELEGDLISKQPLVQVAMWTIGEFADLLVQTTNSEAGGAAEPVSAGEIIDKCEEILLSSHATLITKEYTLNALTKLSVRFSEEAPKVKTIVDSFGVSHSTELQQRAVEFAILFSRHDTLRPNVLEKMPQMTRRERVLENDGDTAENLKAEREPLTAPSAGNSVTVTNSSSALLDLLDLSPTHVPTGGEASTKPLQATIDPGAANDVLDLLGSLDGGGAHSAPTSVAPPATVNSLDALFGSVSNGNASSPALPTTTLTSIPVTATNGDTGVSLFDSAPLSFEPAIPSPMAEKIPSITAYEKNGLRLEFNFSKSPENPLILLISLTASNSNTTPIEEFLFQAAVPKSFQLQLMPPSGTAVPAAGNGSLSQLIKVTNPNKTQLRMRLRLSYKYNGQTLQEQSDVAHFPKQTWQ